MKRSKKKMLARINLQLFDEVTPDMQAMMGTANDMMQEQPYVSPVNENFISKLNDILKEYTQGKKNLENKIIENDKWYRSLHWDLVKNTTDKEIEPVSAYLFSTIANKHADAMDYYPEPNILEREEDDVEEANNLSTILPLVLDKNNFRKVYSDAWWYKLKQGAAAYGIFWNPTSENGLGDIDIQKLDILNIYWQPGVTDIQKSPYLFIVQLIDDETLHQMYPQTKDRIQGVKPLEIKTYVSDDTINTDKKSLIVDCYYKKIDESGKTIVHLTKFVDDIPLASTEDDPQSAAEGLYWHGQYPLFLDVLFPEENSPMGFGYIDIIKNPQMYIDKFDQIISRNALQSGKMRYIVIDNDNINESELADYSKDIIHANGSLEEGKDFITLQGKPIQNFIVQHRENKIAELKEISGSNDFSRGEAGGGVTAMGAILALQEAGNKTSRDMIATSYNVYTQMMYMVVELIRQFYDEPRKFRSEDNQGNPKYITYNNQGLQEQPLQLANGMMPTSDTDLYRKPYFDIKIKPEKASPFSREAQNELAKEMFNMGFFNPQRAAEAKVALELMSFEGKEKVAKAVAQNGDLYMAIQQMQQQMQQMQMVMQGMNEVIKRKTGKDMFATPGQAVQQSIENGGNTKGGQQMMQKV